MFKLHTFWLALLVLVALNFGCSPKKPAQPVQTALSNTAHKVILPLLHQFETAAINLQDAADRFCQNPSNPGELATTRSALIKMDQQWRRLSILSFGPAITTNLQEQVGCLQSQIKQSSSVAELQPMPIKQLPNSAALPYIQQLVYPAIAPEDAFKVPERCENLLKTTHQLLMASQTFNSAWSAKEGNYLGEFLTPHKHAATLQNLHNALIEATTKDACDAPILLEVATGEQIYRNAFAPLLSEALNRKVLQAYEYCQTQYSADCLQPLQQVLLMVVASL